VNYAFVEKEEQAKKEKARCKGWQIEQKTALFCLLFFASFFSFRSSLVGGFFFALFIPNLIHQFGISVYSFLSNLFTHSRHIR